MTYNDLEDNGGNGHYTGRVNHDFVPHGHGVMVYDNGVKVEADWKDGRWRGGGVGGQDQRQTNELNITGYNRSNLDSSGHGRPRSRLNSRDSSRAIS